LAGSGREERKKIKMKRALKRARNPERTHSRKQAMPCLSQMRLEYKAQEINR